MVSLPKSPHRGSGRNNVRVIRTVSLVLAVIFLLWGTMTLQRPSNDTFVVSALDESQQETIKISSTLDQPKTGLRSMPTIPERKRPFPLEGGFVVAGVDLDRYEPGMHHITTAKEKPNVNEEEPFELFHDFNIESMLNGNETWWDLVKNIRRNMQEPSLSFYVDKVAMKRWLPSIGVKTPGSYILKYKTELTTTGKVNDEANAFIDLLPAKGKEDYCAKPTHTSYSDGVWLVKNHIVNGNRIVQEASQGGQPFNGKEVYHDATRAVAKSLAKSLHEPARYYESLALKNVKPGVVVEERFTSFDRDDRAAMEFKVFCVWGRVFVSTWKQGVYTYGIVQRNGLVVRDGPDFRGPEYRKLPDWVNWTKVVELAEKLAANKDMFRVDIFVGRRAGTAAKHQKEEGAKVVLSECEIHPTTVLKDERIFEEAARLWIAGYKIGNYRVVSNIEVPSAFVKTGMLSAADAALLASNSLSNAK